jgi:hypothetical protein
MDSTATFEKNFANHRLHKTITVHSSLPAAAGDGWGWLGKGGDGRDGSVVTEITYGKIIN